MPGAPTPTQLDRAARGTPGEAETWAKRLFDWGTKLANRKTGTARTAGDDPDPEELRAWRDQVKKWQSSVNFSTALFKEKGREQAAIQLGRIRDQYEPDFKRLRAYLKPR